jgi:putative transposase
MSRISRVVVPGLPHHVTQRGNARQDVFATDADRQLYLDLLRHHAKRYDLRIWAYCLMRNHVHLVTVPDRVSSLARVMGRTHADYARYFNLKRGRSGHLWEARFFSCPLQDLHLWRAMAYVERNPVRAALVSEAADYRWSSASPHVLGQEHGWLDFTAWRQQYDGTQWLHVLRTSVEDQAFSVRLRESTRRGRVMGSSAFAGRVGKLLGRELRTLAAGRPRKVAIQQPVQQLREIGV